MYYSAIKLKYLIDPRKRNTRKAASAVEDCINLWVSGSESPKMSELAAKCFMMHHQKKKEQS